MIQQNKFYVMEGDNDYIISIVGYIEESFCTKEQVTDWCRRFYEANGRTWDLESDIRKNQVGDLN